jgi:hypothetical protein
VGSCRSDSGMLSISIIFVPRAFNSTVQPWSSSCTSCGSTDLRDHASSHLGFGGAASIAGCCAPFLTFEGPSLPLSLEKKPGIANAGGGGLSSRDAFDQGTGREKSRGSAMCRLQAGNYMSASGLSRRQSGRRKMQIGSGMDCRPDGEG